MIWHGFPLAAGVPQGGRVNDSITTVHEIYFLPLGICYVYVHHTTHYQLRFMDTAICDAITVSLHTLISQTSFLPSIMASLPVKIGTFIFVLNLSNDLLPDVIGLAWRLCLAQHSMARGYGC